MTDDEIETIELPEGDKVGKTLSQDVNLDLPTRERGQSRTSGDLLDPSGRRPSSQFRRGSLLPGRKLSELGMERRPSKMGGTPADADRAKLWKAFEALDWKDESERKRVYESYEALKRVYLEQRLKTPSDEVAEPRKRRESLLNRIESSLTEIRERRREQTQRALSFGGKQTGFTMAKMPVLQKGEKITLDYVTAMIDEVKEGRIIHEGTVFEILERIGPVLQKINNVQRLPILEGNRITVCGDIHGQLEDFLTIFELNGLPSEQNHYLFNGDFVDRGDKSVEVMVVMFALKLLYPNAMHLNRGNHEARDMNTQHGFEEEVLSKYNAAMFDQFCQCFSYLPLAAVIQEKIFVVHGGMSWQDGLLISDIEEIDRFCEVPPDDSLFEDLLWSDPAEEEGRFENERGCGCVFGPDVLWNFCDTNGLEFVIRSHECVDDGFEWWFDDRFVTVFSASNYCGMSGNKGAFIIIDCHLETSCVQYDATPLGELATVHLSHKSLQNGVISKLCMRITQNRLALMNHFRNLCEHEEKKKARHISREQWATGMKQLLGLDIDFLEFADLLGVPTLGVDGVAGGAINYVSYLARFRPVSEAIDIPIMKEDEEDTSDDEEETSPPGSPGGGEPDWNNVAGRGRSRSKLSPQQVLLADINTLLFTNRYNLESLFRYFDLTGSGIISHQELKDGLLSMANSQSLEGRSFTEAQVDDAVKLIFKRKTNVGLDYHEFFRGFRAAGFSTDYVPASHVLVPNEFEISEADSQACIVFAQEELKSYKVKLGCQFVTGEDETTRLSKIIPGKAASLAGLMAGDIVHSINGNPTPNKKLFRSAVLLVGTGEAAQFSIERDSRFFTVEVTMLAEERSFEEIQRLKRISGGLVYQSDVDRWKAEVRKEQKRAEELKRKERKKSSSGKTAAAAKPKDAPKDREKQDVSRSPSPAGNAARPSRSKSPKAKTPNNDARKANKEGARGRSRSSSPSAKGARVKTEHPKKGSLKSTEERTRSKSPVRGPVWR